MVVAMTLTAVVALAGSAYARGAQIRPLERVHAQLITSPSHAQPPTGRREIPRRTKSPTAQDEAKRAHNRGPLPGTEISTPAPKTAVFGALNAPGLAATDNGFDVTPPDTTGAIGPSHYFEFVNETVRVYDRSNLSIVSTSGLPTFVGKSNDDVFDPQIQWDPQSSRWYYLADDCTNSRCSRNNFIAFGYSKTSDPSDLVNGWCRYTIGTGKDFHDYPKLGHDNNHLVFGTNVYNPSFNRAQVWSVPKPSAGNTCASSLTATGFSLTSTVFTPVPANTSDSSTVGYLVAANSPGSGSASTIKAWHVGGTATSPTLTSDGSMSVTSYSIPANVPQPGTGNVLDSSDTRLTQAVAHADPDASGAEAVWTQHTVAGPGGRSVVRWYEFLPASLTVRQMGTISDTTNYVFNGAISPATDGTSAAINYNVGGSSQLVQIKAQTRTGSTSLSTMSDELTLGTSSAIDQDFSCSPCRWGDYAGASPDPSNSNVIWGSNQLNGPVSSNNARWTTRNFALTTATAASAPTVTTGSASSVTQNSATLNGTVNPNGQATSYHFEYGTTTGYGTPTSAQNAGSGTSNVSVSANISGLSPGTPYHFRLVATNASGTTQGQDQTFTTTSSSTSYRDAVLATTGLNHYWRLGESSGTTATDSKGTSDGTYQGGFTLGQPGAIFGDPDTSVLLNGSTGLVNTPVDPGGAQGTIEFWGYATDLGSRNGFVYTADDGTGTASHQIGVRSDGSVRLHIYDGTTRIADSAAGLVSTNEWHYYALTWTDGGSAILYVDGVNRGSTAIGTSWKSGNKLLLGGPGSAGSGLTNRWQGRIDEAALYNSALSAATVQQHYNTGIGL
jgi:hypothetical protein